MQQMKWTLFFNSALILEVTNKTEAIVKMKSNIVTKTVWESWLSQELIPHNPLKEKNLWHAGLRELPL